MHLTSWFLLSYISNYIKKKKNHAINMCAGAIARRRAYFGSGSGPILLADMFCSGDESSLLDCNRNMFGMLSCNHFEDAGVTCEGEKNCII